MNKTIPSYEPAVTEQELRSLIDSELPAGACCSTEKPKENHAEAKPTEPQSACCCH